MEHMRMDPKHQFAAQYVLSRAAAERRERETLLAAVSAASAASSSGLLALTGMGQPCKYQSPPPTLNTIQQLLLLWGKFALKRLFYSEW